MIHSKKISYYNSDHRTNGGNVRHLYPKYILGLFEELISKRQLSIAIHCWVVYTKLRFCIRFELLSALYRINMSLLTTFCIFV
jgi:hypothetical protein